MTYKWETNYKPFVVEWKVTDKSDTSYASVAEFFAASTADEALIKQHTDIDIGVVIAKVNILSEDGKSFVRAITFDNEENYIKWSKEKEKLPAIDEHLTYTLEGSVLVNAADVHRWSEIRNKWLEEKEKEKG
jgi:hypothetical protein